MMIAQLYLPTVLPQWGIFAGIVLLTVGYVEKKSIWTFSGWIVLIVTSLAAVYFNLFGELNAFPEKETAGSAAAILVSTGWQTATGGLLALASLLMYNFKRKRYPILAGLTIAYFILTFFLYTQGKVSDGKAEESGQKTEQKQ